MIACSLQLRRKLRGCRPRLAELAQLIAALALLQFLSRKLPHVLVSKHHAARENNKARTWELLLNRELSNSSASMLCSSRA